MRKQLALVVHGIGEQSAGETVHDLVGGLTGKSSVEVKSDLRMLHQPHPKGEDKPSDPTPDMFPCHISRIRHDKGETVFAEVFWADLSGGHSGALRTIYDIVKLTLGLGHIASRGAEALHGETHWLTKLTNLVVHMLHGPVTACNAILLAGVFILLFTPLWTSPHIAGLAVACLALTVGYLGLRQAGQKHLFTIFCRWLLGLGAGMALIVLYTFLSGTDGRRELQALGYGCPQGGGCLAPWFALFPVYIVSIASQVILAAVPIMIITQWWLDRSEKGSDPRSIFHIVAAFMVVLWLTIVAVLWVFILRTWQDGLANFGIDVDVIAENTTQIGLLFAGLLALVVAGLMVFLRVQTWRRDFASNKAREDSLPRLILNPIIRLTLSIVVLVMGAAMVMTLATYLGFPMLRWLDGIADRLAISATAVALIIATLYSAGSDTIAHGVAVAKDVVAYFKHEPGNNGWHHPLRDRMRGRFQAVAAVMAESENPDEVVVISHSLGTMIATDAVANADVQRLLQGDGNREKPTLVTMGCPYSHLFTHYFGAFFPPPATFQNHVSRWLNIYRADDFVGTRVGNPGDSWPENRQVPPRGHIGYWADPDVMNLLVPEIFPFDQRQLRLDQAA